MKLKTTTLGLAIALVSLALPLGAQTKKPEVGMTPPKGDVVSRPVDNDADDEIFVGPRYELIESSALRRTLKRSYGQYRRAERNRVRATKTKSRTKRARYLKSAARDFDRALAGSDVVLAKAKSLRAKREAKRLMRAFSRAAYGAHVALGEAYTTRGAYRRALDAADRALALRPRDASATNLKQRIQLARAAASSKGGGF